MSEQPEKEGLSGKPLSLVFSYLGFGKIADPTIDSTFEEMDFGEDHFVVETFEFGEKVVDKDKGGLELLRLELSIGICEMIKAKKWATTTDIPTSRVSRLCLRNTRFSALAHAMLSVRVLIWVSRLLGMAEKKSRRVRTGEMWVNEIADGRRTH